MKSPHLNSTLAGHSPSSCCEARNQRVPRARSHVGASLLSGAAGWHRAVPVELGGAGALFASLNPQPRAPTPQQLPRAPFCKGLRSHRLKWALLLQPRAWPGRSMFRAVPLSLSCPRPAFLRKGLRAWSWGWGEQAGARPYLPAPHAASRSAQKLGHGPAAKSVDVTSGCSAWTERARTSVDPGPGSALPGPGVPWGTSAVPGVPFPCPPQDPAGPLLPHFALGATCHQT